MRPSHIQAPRQLSDCAFTPSADPIERHVRPFDAQGRVIKWACIVTVLATAFLVLT